MNTANTAKHLEKGEGNQGWRLHPHLSTNQQLTTKRWRSEGKIGKRLECARYAREKQPGFVQNSPCFSTNSPCSERKTRSSPRFHVLHSIIPIYFAIFARWIVVRIWHYRPSIPSSLSRHRGAAPIYSTNGAPTPLPHLKAENTPPATIKKQQ